MPILTSLGSQKIRCDDQTDPRADKLGYDITPGLVMTPVFAKGSTLILIICAVIITALLVRRELFLSEIPVSDAVPVYRLSDTTWWQAME